MSGLLPNVDLPDDVLVVEISRLPLVEQVRIGQVSARFHRLMTRALCLVDSLTVLLDYDNDYESMGEWFSGTISPDLSRYIQLHGTSEYDRDALLGFRRFDERVTLRFSNEGPVNLAWLPTSMPNLRKLMLVRNGGNSNVEQVVTLLNGWSSTLVSLTLLCHPTGLSMTVEDSSRLFGSINSLASLQDLFLEFMYRFDSARLDLPILRQLRRFHFYSKDVSNELLLTSLRQYVLPGNRAMQQILLGKEGTEQAEGQYMPDYLRLDRCITSKVTALYNDFEKSEQDGPMVDLLCSKFTSLTYLKLSVVSPVYTPVQLVNALSSLAQLYHLDLNLSGATAMKISAQEANRDDRASAGGARLASIQVLVINCGQSYNHRDLSHLYDFAFTFPGLRVAQVIDMKFRECARCRVQKLSLGQVLTPGFTQIDQRPIDCIRRLTSTLQRCPLICKLMLDEPSLDTDGYSVNHLINREILYH